MIDEEVERMFEEGIALLDSIKGKKGSVIAYRAGAYCIQTYPRFKDVFKKYGIRVDSSVLRNHRSISEYYQNYDYRRLPKEYCYWFEDDVTVKDENGSFLEVSIPSYKIGKKELLVKKRELQNYRQELKKWGDGLPGLTTLESKFKRLVMALKARLMRGQDSSQVSTRLMAIFGVRYSILSKRRIIC